ncbi:MAG: zinc ribbon domain-containing protein [Candidatus Thorarchaeota archaeon]
MRSKIGIILLVISGILISGAISQIVYVYSNRSKLIWSKGCYQDTGYDFILLPEARNDFTIIAEAEFIYEGDQIFIDIYFFHIAESRTYHTFLEMTAFKYQAVYRDAAIITLPVGEYNLSWDCDWVCSNYHLYLYENGIFVQNADPSLGREKFFFLTSLSVLIVLSTVGGILILLGIIKIKNASRIKISKEDAKIIKKKIKGICPYCGAKLSPGYNICSHCGEKV